MKNNQFLSRIASQGERKTIHIPLSDLKRFEKFIGKDIKITIEEI